MSDYKMGDKYLVHRGFEDDGTDKGWVVAIYRGQVDELANFRFKSKVYQFYVKSQGMGSTFLVGEDEIKPFNHPIPKPDNSSPYINPDIQPSEGMEIYRGASFRAFRKPRGQDAIKANINIPLPIIRDAIKSFDGKVFINYIIVIGIAVTIVLLGILGANK